MSSDLLILASCGRDAGVLAVTQMSEAEDLFAKGWSTDMNRLCGLLPVDS